MGGRGQEPGNAGSLWMLEEAGTDPPRSFQKQPALLTTLTLILEF